MLNDAPKYHVRVKKEQEREPINHQEILVFLELLAIFVKGVGGLTFALQIRPDFSVRGRFLAISREKESDKTASSFTLLVIYAF